MITVIDYCEWKRKNPDLYEKAKIIADEENKKYVECSSCCGKGRHECDCGHEHECARCDGTGEVPKEIDADDVLMKMYKEQFKHDEKLWFSFAGVELKEPVSRYHEHGIFST